MGAPNFLQKLGQTGISRIEVDDKQIRVDLLRERLSLGEGLRYVSDMLRRKLLERGADRRRQGIVLFEEKNATLRRRPDKRWKGGRHEGNGAEARA